jgi:hypothetical protein
MTEAQWNRCTDPKAMLAFLRNSGGACERKLQLFAVACCRSLWHLLPDERSRNAVEVAERLADGLATAKEKEAATVAARDARRDAVAARQRSGYRIPEYPAHAAAVASFAVCSFDTGVAEDAVEAATAVIAGCSLAASYRQTRLGGRRGLKRRCAGLLRELFGNPLRPAVLTPLCLHWHGGLIPQFARAIYNERQLPAGTLDASRLALLADMLADAGCTDAALVEHLRGPGPHARGCWGVDTLLAA